MSAPTYGPHDDDMTLRDWFDITLRRAADTEAEAEGWWGMMSHLRSEYSCREVGDIKLLARTQLEAAATTCLGSNPAKGTVRLVLKYLGSKGEPHIPPGIQTNDEGDIGGSSQQKDVKFGRQGKTGRNSNESNFPEAMQPSSSASLKSADVVFPKPLKQYLLQVEARYKDQHLLMPQRVAMELCEEVSDWVVSTYGTSPVRSMHSITILAAVIACELKHA